MRSLPRIIIKINLLIALLGVTSLAQEPVASEGLTRPDKEIFKKNDQLIAPLVRGDCAENWFPNEPNCELIRHYHLEANKQLTIYNSDGSDWYKFGTFHTRPGYFGSNPKTGFRPLVSSFPDHVVLRLVGESENWYEAEVNDETRETKFISKHDATWTVTSWDHWLKVSYNLEIDGTHIKLLDVPNGKVIEETRNIEFRSVQVRKVEGDWVYVKGGFNYQSYFGWIRWRDGRNILVGCILNDYKREKPVTSK